MLGTAGHGEAPVQSGLRAHAGAGRRESALLCAPSADSLAPHEQDSPLRRH